MQNIQSTKPELNLLPYITSATLKNGVSKQTQRPYVYLDLLFSNGYSKMVFLNQESEFLLRSLADEKQKPNTAEQIPVSIN